jgi:hypothetical protein
MSSTWQATSDILPINDEEVVTIGRSNTTKQVLERNIEIGLGCEISLEDRSFRNGKLRVSNWGVGTTELYGACAFCNLPLDGLQQTLIATYCD